MGQLLVDHWEGVIATIALVQTWIYWLWRYIFRKAKVEIYPSGSIEIGYSEFGPTLGLNGAIQAQHGDVFIKSIRVRARRVRTNEEHWFVWLAFRSPTIFFDQTRTPPMEMPAGFIVSQSQPHRFNIVFHDPDAQKAILPSLQKLRPLALQLAGPAAYVRGSGNWRDIYDRQFSEFSARPEHLAAFDIVNRNVYWQPDQYTLELHVDTDKADSVFIKQWVFHLDDESVDRLRLNTTSILDNPFRVMAGDTPWDYGFAYVEYRNQPA